MPNKSISSSTALGVELADALDRSLQTSIASLASLREAVRAYTLDGRDNGGSVENVCAEVLKTLTAVEDGRGQLLPVRDTELARQIQVWCHEDFLRRN